MTGVMRRLLLLPVLAPLLAVAGLALLNPQPAVALRLLTWTSPALPIGSWLALAVAGGGLLSGAATAAALQSPIPRQRRVRRPAVASAPGDAEPDGWPEPPVATAGPARPPGAPPPTVSVPFRVIRKGSPPPPPPGAAPTASRSDPSATAVASAVGDGWSDTPSDDW